MGCLNLEMRLELTAKYAKHAKMWVWIFRSVRVAAQVFNMPRLRRLCGVAADDYKYVAPTALGGRPQVLTVATDASLAGHCYKNNLKPGTTSFTASANLKRGRLKCQ
jgi:hypothetical protein